MRTNYGETELFKINKDVKQGVWFGLMGWSLLPSALQPFKIYCAPPSIISQLVLFLWQTVEIDPLGHVRVVEDTRRLLSPFCITKL